MVARLVVFAKASEHEKASELEEASEPSVSRCEACVHARGEASGCEHEQASEHVEAEILSESDLEKNNSGGEKREAHRQQNLQNKEYKH